jgi:hypothetical protein
MNDDGLGRDGFETCSNGLAPRRMPKITRKNTNRT